MRAYCIWNKYEIIRETEWEIMNRQSRDTGNIGHTIYLSKN